MRTFRKILFWLHLCSGVIAGLVIALMSLTGAALAFESQITDWADHDARQVQMPAPDAARLPVDDLVARVRAAQPDAQISGVTLYPEPTSAVLVNTGRASGVYVNPYTGEVRAMASQGWRAFFHGAEELHRWLGAQGDNRAMGRAVTGVCNAAFLFLAVSGLYLWFPRKWTWKTFRPAIWFRRGLKGKARDFNWHNTIGFWSLPVIVILTLSGMVMSYRWASDLLFTLMGSKPPVAQGPPGAPSIKVPAPPEGTKPLGLEPLFAEAQKHVSAWESISVRMGGGPRGEAPGGQRGNERGGSRGNAPSGPQAQTFSIREKGAWPLFASVQVSLNPFTAELLRQETFSDYDRGRQARTWMRFLHTGEALGWLGQLVAAIASLGALVLVWTGFFLAWRRFAAWRRVRAIPAGASSAQVESETPV